MKTYLFLLALAICATSTAQTGNFYGSTDGSKSVDLKLGKNGSGSSFRIYTEDPGGSTYWQIHGRRWGTGYTWSRESSYGTDKNIAYLYGASSGHYYQLFNNNQNVKVQFHSNGDSFVDGGNFGVGTSSPNFHFHTVGSDRARFEQTEGIIDIVAYGSSGNDFDNTAGLFASNRSALVMTGLSESGDIKFITRPSGYSERMIIKSNGNIGIGTSSPDDALEVVGGISVNGLSRGDTNSAWGSLNNKPVYSLVTGRNNGNENALHGFGVVKTTHFESPFIYGYDMPGNMIVFGSVGSGNRNPSTGLTPRMSIDLNDGDVGIGTTTPDAKLAVNGTIHSKEVKVDLNGWPDFVFSDNYNLPNLEEVETYISENKHLPEIPSEAEVTENGINLGEMNAKLLQKVEELTLYMIEQNKQNQAQQEQLEAQATLIQQLRNEVNTLKNNK